VPTTRADRYLAQLIDHLGHLGDHGSGGHGHGHGSPPAVGRIERSGDRAEIEVAGCVIELTAAPTELLLVVRAEDAETMARGRGLIQGRVETIGRRDQLQVTWF
jgi:hypothetical protein